MAAPRFGIVFLPESLRGFGELCAEAEIQGFDWLGVADSQSVFRELYVALAQAALHTRRIRLGPLVTNPLTRHLVVTASAISSVDELSGGRAMLGLGSGDSALYTIGAPPATLAGLEEAVVTLGRLTAGETVGATSHPKILRAARAPIDGAWLDEELTDLERMVERGETLDVVSRLTAMLREPKRAGSAVLEDTLH